MIYVLIITIIILFILSIKFINKMFLKYISLYFKKDIDLELTYLIEAAWNFVFVKHLAIYYSQHTKIDDRNVAEFQATFLNFFSQVCGKFYYDLFLYRFGSDEKLVTYLTVRFNQNLLKEQAKQKADKVTRAQKGNLK